VQHHIAVFVLFSVNFSEYYIQINVLGQLCLTEIAYRVKSYVNILTKAAH